MWYPTAMWQWQLMGFVFLSVLSRIAESKAAMRGCKREPIPSMSGRALLIPLCRHRVTRPQRAIVLRGGEKNWQCGVELRAWERPVRAAGLGEA